MKHPTERILVIQDACCQFIDKELLYTVEPFWNREGKAGPKLNKKKLRNIHSLCLRI